MSDAIVMSEAINSVSPVRAFRRAGISSLAVLALTVVHHAYGALLYDTPWRLHAAVVAAVIALAIVRALYLAGSKRGTSSGRRWAHIAMALILVFPVILIGLVEGGYNHLVKDLVYLFSGPQAARTLFPSPTYEMPSDLVFELSGVAQLPLSFAAAYFAMAIRPGRRTGNGMPSELQHSGPARST